MLRIKFGHFAMIFGVLGIALLYVVTVLSQPVLVSDFSNLEDFEGEVVSVEGTVLFQHLISDQETVITLYNNRQTLELVTEFGTGHYDNTRVNTILRATGEVQKKFNGEYQLVVLDPTNLVTAGTFEPPSVSWSDQKEHNNSYIAVAGTITHLEDYFGDKQRLTLRNGSESLDVILLTPGISLKIGNNIEASGILRGTDGDYRLYIYTSDVIRVTGQWHITTIGLEDLMSEPERCTDFPTYLQGVVRYEPYSDPAYSFYLSNSALDSSISLRVELSGFDQQLTLHKGDIVTMLTYTIYDPATLRYELNPVEMQVIGSCEDWQVTIDELSENQIEYERASLNLTGYLYMDNNSYFLGNRAVMDNCSYLLKVVLEEKEIEVSNGTKLMDYLDLSIYGERPVDSPNKGIRTTLHGRLLYRQEHFDYVFTLKAEPASSF